jgi:hypothetical protein
MKNRIGHVTKMLGFCMAAVFISGCLSDRVNLADNSWVSLDPVPAGSIYILRAITYKESNENEAFAVHGMIKRKIRGGVGDHGHIDVAIVGPEGTVLDQVSTPHFPDRVPRRMDQAYFNARLSSVPPQGSIVRVAYHRSVRPVWKTSDCHNNAALPPLKDTRR